MAHKKRRKRLNIVSFPNPNTFVDCYVASKVEYIIHEEESVEDPLSIQGETTKVESDNVVIKEEVSNQ